MAKPAWYGGNKIPKSYLEEMNRRYYASTGQKPPERHKELPADLEQFVCGL